MEELQIKVQYQKQGITTSYMTGMLTLNQSFLQIIDEQGKIVMNTPLLECKVNPIRNRIGLEVKHGAEGYRLQFTGSTAVDDMTQVSQRLQGNHSGFSKSGGYTASWSNSSSFQRTFYIIWLLLFLGGLAFLVVISRK